MKKTIMGMMFLGSCCAAIAQDDQPANSANTTLQSSSNYSAYGPAVNVPASAQMALTKDYPTATNVTWQKNSEWHRASYRNSNRNMHVYFSPNGSSYAVALPVVQGFVAEEVIAKALDNYGDRLYSITRLKAADGQDTYQVTLTENGSSSTEWINEDGSMRTDVYRTAEVETTETKMAPATNNQSSGPNADISEEQIDYSAVSPDDDYTYGYEEQMEWTTTAANTGTDLPEDDNQDETSYLSNNSNALLPNDEE